MQPSPAPAPRPIRRRKTKIALGILALLVFCVVAFLFRPMASGPGPAPAEDRPLDVAVIGGGVMSVTLATYLQELEPNWRVAMFERLDNVAEESSNGWNNAGTGHSGFAELNYTPEKDDGSIDTTKAVQIAEQFEVARQFWAHEVKTGRLGAPNGFINPTPHMSFVWGDENIDYLRRRQAALVKNPLFYGMEFTRDPARIRAWAPLVMEGRDPNQKVAATYMPIGTDVNWGVITTQLTNALTKTPISACSCATRYAVSAEATTASGT